MNKYTIARPFLMVLVLMIGIISLAEAAPAKPPGPTRPVIITNPNPLFNYFKCGSDLLAYEAFDASGATIGVRCIKFDGTYTGLSGDIRYHFHWYGEGHNGNSSYRHIGFEYDFGYDGEYAYQADMSGNGESFNNVLVRSVGFPNNHNSSLLPLEIGMYSGGNLVEIWRQAISVNYTPLAIPKVCGSNFDTYNVQGSGAPGIRCVLKEGGAWFGIGVAPNGRPTAHLGGANWIGNSYYTFSGVVNELCYYGAASCRSFDNLLFTPTSDRQGYNVTGDLNEYWHK